MTRAQWAESMRAALDGIFQLAQPPEGHCENCFCADRVYTVKISRQALANLYDLAHPVGLEPDAQPTKKRRR